MLETAALGFRRDCPARRDRLLALLATTGALALVPPQAAAQSVEENAVEGSGDAFGRSVGNESTGLYTSREIRGFSPIDAGNVRMDSLYFDQVNNPSYRMLDGTTIRVGFTTMSFPFPAPSGLVDYALTDYGTETRLTIDINGETDKDFPNLAAELRLPIDGERLGIYAGGAALFQRTADGRTYRMDTFGSVGTWRPMPGGEVSVFAWRANPRGEEASPTFFVTDEELPPEIERNYDLSQPWTDNAKINQLVGVLGHIPLGGGFRLDAAVFSDRSSETARFADQLLSVGANGSVGERVIIADRGGEDHSISGEVRLSHTFSTQHADHRITASLRGRSRDRLFGGAQRISLGASTILQRDERDAVAFTPAPKNSDEVRQVFYGGAYSGDFFDRLLADASLSGTNYIKHIDFADPTRADVETQGSPLLWNVSAALDISARLSLFGGMARGMEDALIAPDRAVNRAEAPPAIRTRQEELGLRYSLGDTFAGVVGLFRISKPYYNLDPVLNYRLLGTVVNEGIELSMVTRPLAGLTILGGALISDPSINGEAVDNGLVGARPVGQADTRLVANVDWRLDGGQSPLSFDLAFERLDGRIGNAANTLVLPARTNFDLGMRYRFRLGPAAMLFRVRVQNLFADYSWNATGSGGLTYSDPRRLELQLIADF